MPRQQSPYSVPPQTMRDNGRRSGSSHRDRNIDQTTHRVSRHHPFADAREDRETHHKRKALKNHMIAMSGEFVGTTMFLFFAFAGTQVAAMISPGELSIDRVQYIAMSFGFSLLVVVWAFYRVSGGLFNPAVRCSFP
jgi:Major intrinsic protein